MRIRERLARLALANSVLLLVFGGVVWTSADYRSAGVQHSPEVSAKKTVGAEMVSVLGRQAMFRDHKDNPGLHLGHQKKAASTTVPSLPPDSTTTASTTLPSTSTSVVTTTQPPGTTSSTTAPPNTTVPPTSAPSTSTTVGSSNCQGVQVAAGSNLATVASAHGAGTTFCLATGTFSVTAVIPTQSGDRWIGSNRSSILTGNDSTSTVFAADGVSNVTVSGLVIEHFNTPVGGGLAALKTGSGWIVENNEIRYNATAGIYHPSAVQVRGNFIHHNGQYGITGYQSVNAVVEGNEVSFNNTKGFDDSDQGGAKWTGTTNLIVRDNYFHDNYHTGIWLDANHINAVIEDNVVTNNTYHGIHFEISCSGIIRGNSVSGNDETGIFVNASQNTEVANNTVAANGEGIRVWAQDRGDGACNWIAQNVSVHDNYISMSSGYSGLQQGSGQGAEIFTNGSVTFAGNDYDVPDPAGKWFHWSGSLRTWAEWLGYGQDGGGSIT